MVTSLQWSICNNVEIFHDKKDIPKKMSQKVNVIWSCFFKNKPYTCHVHWDTYTHMHTHAQKNTSTDLKNIRKYRYKYFFTVWEYEWSYMNFILYVLMNRSYLYVILEVWAIIYNCIAYLYISYCLFYFIYWDYLATISLKTLIYFKN